MNKRCPTGLELLADPVIPVCCFRPTPANGRDVDELTVALHEALTASGSFYTTLCHPNGTAYLRVAVNNHTRDEHVDELVDTVVRLRAALHV